MWMEYEKYKDMDPDWDLFEPDCKYREWNDPKCLNCINLYSCHTPPKHPDDRYDDETEFIYNILEFSEPVETIKDNISYTPLEILRANRRMIGYGYWSKDKKRFYDYGRDNLIIPDTFESDGVNYIVNSIGKGGFFHCDDLKVVSLPHTVKSIGSQAFDECLKLEAIYIGKGLEKAERVFILCDRLRKIKIHRDNPYFCDVDGVMYSKDMKVLVRYPQDKIGEEYVVPDGVERIGTLAFYGCERLKSIILPDSVKEIDEGAFWYCRKLVSINLPDGITALNDNVFMACNSLESIDIPESVSIIGKCAFDDCERIKVIKLPEKISSIGDFAFSCCHSLESINLPQGITKISKGLFHRCNSLSSLELPQNIESIGDFAFDSCPFTTLTIPSSVKYLGKAIFDDCSNLTHLIYKGWLYHWTLIEKETEWDKINGYQIGIRVKCE